MHKDLQFNSKYENLNLNTKILNRNFHLNKYVILFFFRKSASVLCLNKVVCNDVVYQNRKGL